MGRFQFKKKIDFSDAIQLACNDFFKECGYKLVTPKDAVPKSTLNRETSVINTLRLVILIITLCLVVTI